MHIHRYSSTYIKMVRTIYNTSDPNNLTCQSAKLKRPQLSPRFYGPVTGCTSLSLSNIILSLIIFIRSLFSCLINISRIKIPSFLPSSSKLPYNSTSSSTDRGRFYQTSIFFKCTVLVIVVP